MGIAHYIQGLSGWGVVIALTLVVGIFLPSTLRAIGNFKLTLKAGRFIEGSEDAVQVIRIINASGADPGPTTPPETSPPTHHPPPQ